MSLWLLGRFDSPVRCTVPQRSRYRGRISGPLLDRMDLHVEVPRLTGAELTGSTLGEPSADVYARVVRARTIQASRGTGAERAPVTNGTMPPALVRRWCVLPEDARAFLRRAIDRLGLSPRAYERIVRIARTIADLDGSRDIAFPQVAEAVAYRTLDRPLIPWDRPPDPAAGGGE